MCLYLTVGGVLVGRHDHAIDRAKVQVPQHMAGGQRGNEHFFRIVAFGIPHVARIGGALDRRLTSARNLVISSVRVVSRRAPTLVARPGKNGRISVFPGGFDFLSFRPGGSNCHARTHSNSP